MTTSSLRAPSARSASTYWMPSNFTVPSYLASWPDCSEMRDAVPPMWNVRIVSCVPGSPMDCAAMTPTAWPSSTIRPVDRSRP